MPHGVLQNGRGWNECASDTEQALKMTGPLEGMVCSISESLVSIMKRQPCRTNCCIIKGVETERKMIVQTACRRGLSRKGRGVALAADQGIPQSVKGQCR